MPIESCLQWGRILEERLTIMPEAAKTTGQLAVRYLFSRVRVGEIESSVLLMKAAALNVNSATLAQDSSAAGVRIEPKHLQQTMRELAGVAQSSAAQSFPLDAGTLSLLSS
ncbi:MAG: hypothetical protein ACI945_000460 [Pseudohongiellaceae bacterium]